MGLSQLYRERMKEVAKKYKDPSLCAEQEYPVQVPTGFLGLDYANGMRVEYSPFNQNSMITYDSIGVAPGSINMFIGNPGAGKTTAALQIARNIAGQFENSFVMLEDPEHGSSKGRIRLVSGCGQDFRTWDSSEIQDKFVIRDKGVYIESFRLRVLEACELKKQQAILNPKEFLYNTGVLDAYGKPVYNIIPSVVILDSLPQLVSSAIFNADVNDDTNNNMTAANLAKQYKAMLREIKPRLEEANVILFIINHIYEDINTGFFPKAAKNNYLKQGETVAGGMYPLYISNNLFRFTTSTKLTKDKEFGINGYHVKCEFIKSRSNRSGRIVPLVYNQERGFDTVLSMYQMIKENNLVSGGGAWMYLKNRPDLKFQQRHMKEKFETDLEFRIAFKEAFMMSAVPLLSGATPESYAETLRQERERFEEINALDDVVGL